MTEKECIFSYAYSNRQRLIPKADKPLLSEANFFGPLGNDDMLNHQAILKKYWSHDVAIASALELKNHVTNKLGHNV